MIKNKKTQLTNKKEQKSNPQNLLSEQNPTCLRCGKKLKTAISRKRGYGKKCFKIYLNELQKTKERKLF